MYSYFKASSIVLKFVEGVSRYILDSLNCFSVTTEASNYLPTLPTGVSSFCTTFSPTAIYVCPSVIPDPSIAPLSFKRASNALIKRQVPAEDVTYDCINMSHHALMGLPAARLETLALVKQMYVLV